MGILNRIIPFIFLGIGLVALAFGIVILAYLFFFGAVLGIVMFLAMWLRDKFFPQKKIAPKKSNRVIDSDDWKKL